MNHFSVWFQHQLVYLALLCMKPHKGRNLESLQGHPCKTVTHQLNACTHLYCSCSLSCRNNIFSFWHLAVCVTVVPNSATLAKLSWISLKVSCTRSNEFACLVVLSRLSRTILNLSAPNVTLPKENPWHPASHFYIQGVSLCDETRQNIISMCFSTSPPIFVPFQAWPLRSEITCHTTNKQRPAQKVFSCLLFVKQCSNLQTMRRIFWLWSWGEATLDMIIWQMHGGSRKVTVFSFHGLREKDSIGVYRVGGLQKLLVTWAYPIMYCSIFQHPRKFVQRRTMKFTEPNKRLDLARKLNWRKCNVGFQKHKTDQASLKTWMCWSTFHTSNSLTQVQRQEKMSARNARTQRQLFGSAWSLHFS